jgi:hypothetical protein
MQAHTSKVKHSSSTSHRLRSHTPDSVTQSCQADHKTAARSFQRKAQRDIRDPTMLSDPLDGSSSDTQSFDEDEMYGSDSGVETISLKPNSKEDAGSADELMVCKLAHEYIEAILLRMQDTELSTQLESLELNTHRVSLIVEALGEAAGIDVSSLKREARDQLSGRSSPQIASDMPLQTEGDACGSDC